MARIRMTLSNKEREEMLKRFREQVGAVTVPFGGLKEKDRKKKGKKK